MPEQIDKNGARQRASYPEGTPESGMASHPDSPAETSSNSPDLNLSDATAPVTGLTTGLEHSRYVAVALRVLKALYRDSCRKEGREIEPEAAAADFFDRRLDETFVAFGKVAKAVNLTMMSLVCEVGAAMASKSLLPIAGKNAAAEEINADTLEDPALMVPMLVAALPAVEEALFRLAPSVCHDVIERFVSKKSEEHADRTPRSAWTLGAFTALVFAAAHNLQLNNPDGNLIATNALPLPQLIFGLFTWHAMRKHGFSTAVLMHAMTNAISLAAVALSRST